MASRIPFSPDPLSRRDDPRPPAKPNSTTNGTLKANAHGSLPAEEASDPDTVSRTDTDVPARRRYVFTDPVAFRYLEDDPSTVVLERRGLLKGYELYLVEQWACSRVHPTFVITTFTGDPNHSVVVGVLAVPTNEETWSPRLRVYFRAVSQFHARPKETHLGMLMVTNLSAFPSALTVIPIPDGDIRKHREDFIINEDLKRLGCSGRSGLSIAPPAAATQAKFHQLYKTSDRNPLYSAVVELVKLCQVALMAFGKLDQEYADGLLCDITEAAISDWWTEIGSEYYNLEPSDGILGPTTVAALLGMLLGARNRLNYYGAPVSKDAFDVSSLKRGIAYFQKAQKLDRSRRLDRQTLDRLHRVTAKAAAGEGWGVPKAVKSTVAELSGKGGEMVMGMVGGRDKAGIGDIETLDIDRFVALAHGERSKWLWYGKPRRHGTTESFGKSLPDMSNTIFTKDDQGGYIWSSRKTESFPLDDEPDIRRKETSNTIQTAKPTEYAGSFVETTGAEKDPQFRRTVFKSVTGKMSDARSGFGRIKDAVGLRGHAARLSKDENLDSAQLESYFGSSTSTLAQNTAEPLSPAAVGKSFTWKNKPEEYHNGFRKDKDPLATASAATRLRNSESPKPGPKLYVIPSEATQAEESREASEEAESKWTALVRETRRETFASEPSVAGSVFEDGDVEGLVIGARRDRSGLTNPVLRRHSISKPVATTKSVRNEAWWQRHLSFSDAEEAVLRWADVAPSFDDGDDDDTVVALQKQKCLVSDFEQVYSRVISLRDDTGAWVRAKIDSVEGLDTQASRDEEDFQTLFYQLNEESEAIKHSANEALVEERARINEAIKDVEVLDARLDYELNALLSKVEDVEDGVRTFARQVEDVELRADDLEVELGKEGWFHWIVRMGTGIGAVPVIAAKKAVA